MYLDPSYAPPAKETKCYTCDRPVDRRSEPLYEPAPRQFVCQRCCEALDLGPRR